MSDDAPALLLRPEQAAKVLGVKPRTLADWRLTGKGPPFVRLSRRAIRYSRRDLDAWQAERTYRSTSEVPV